VQVQSIVMSLAEPLPKGNYIITDAAMNDQPNGFHLENDLSESLEAICPGLADRVNYSLRIINKALDMVKCEELAISFNGGKDSVVLLHLLSLAVAIKNKQQNQYSLSKMITIYFVLKNTFEQVTRYVEEAAEKYNLQLVILGDFIPGLKQIKANYCVKGIFMGTRRGDPHGNSLFPFQETDTEKGWPLFTRINPILEWNYHEIWHFITFFQLPYCALYDHGYTSIGQKNDTQPNPALAFIDSDGCTKYYPAYKLEDGNKERDGRKSTKT